MPYFLGKTVNVEGKKQKLPYMMVKGMQLKVVINHKSLNKELKVSQIDFFKGE